MSQSYEYPEPAVSPGALVHDLGMGQLVSTGLGQPKYGADLIWMGAS